MGIAARRAKSNTKPPGARSRRTDRGCGSMSEESSDSAGIERAARCLSALEQSVSSVVQGQALAVRRLCVAFAAGLSVRALSGVTAGITSATAAALSERFAAATTLSAVKPNSRNKVAASADAP